MTTQEWKDLPDMQSVARAQADGWEIEICADDIDEWLPWMGKAWCEWKRYRGRPKQPRTSTVTVLGWLAYGKLIRQEEGYTVMPEWKRVPAEDKVIEVEE